MRDAMQWATQRLIVCKEPLGLAALSRKGVAICLQGWLCRAECPGRHCYHAVSPGFHGRDPRRRQCKAAGRDVVAPYTVDGAFGEAVDGVNDSNDIIAGEH
jgi:hypothetical protein